MASVNEGSDASGVLSVQIHAAESTDPEEVLCVICDASHLETYFFKYLKCMLMVAEKCNKKLHS